MKKFCYVCGQEIKRGDFYYNIGPNSYVCGCDECFNFYFWDDLAAQMSVNRWHEYAIINGIVYQIGSDEDEPRGYGGKHWAIQFNDGICVETNSLWYKGELPARLKNDFKDNARFISQ